MTKIHSQLSPIQMITALETTVYLLESYPTSLNDYAKACLLRLGISLVVNMENKPEGLITMLRYSAIPDAPSAAHVQERLSAVKTAMESLMPGAWAKYFSEPLNNPPPPMWQDT